MRLRTVKYAAALASNKEGGVTWVSNGLRIE